MKNLKKIFLGINSLFLLPIVFLFVVIVVNFIEDNIFKSTWEIWNDILDDIFKEEPL